ncbi:RadB recombinase [Thermococcus kodakarensis KOD1]|uniref:DNA repair and recombination protein RadB n=1 Tax=Thermococcus kodakarensis (strain ATCC BAA-918 / JCM 12380 / KOD1) TaxID=69014 RepID=RADB_THEKO|nr:DNA repair and recombination protein RadB [Thermococcus kodakarensis]P95547.2 RecName: Full=DNA repair and recombination protein RadB [Thermococcus kodakarensis KOD1]2CVF_A Chain A, DNA repair and recombination protein radB [Thermococcus kodakarensis]2CVF_B Chain B, DNA repair and recombination protein radB [Thermococcus kodakarensis]2CVH_A Chain A, DNA repair and recombination protein radB [Thermococcus kodakarensis]2CVH_B Chain B, DNA repair and recombination protein radB [Thermococcus ko
MLSTGTKSLDSLLGGGFAPGVLTQVYGPYASGKTTLALQTGLLSGKKVAYVDTEGGFSPERLVQMAETRGLNPEEALSRFILFTPSDFKEQRRVIGSLKKTVDSNFALVVVDSITAHYRAEENRSGLIAELSRQLQVLLWIARKHNIPVIVINQVHFDSRTEMTKPVAEQTLGYRCKDILRLDKLPKPGLRVAVLERHRFRPEGLMAYFRITERGIEDVE